MSKGFTFIELVVATGILLVLVGFGTASYVNFNERNLLEKEAIDLKQTLREAQANAIDGVKDNALCDPDGAAPLPPETFRGWCISPVYTDPLATAGDPYDAYQIYGVCDTDEDGVDVRTFPASGNIRPLSLPEGVVLFSRAFSPNLPAPGYVTNTVDARARFNVFGDDVRFADDTYTKVVFCLQGSFPSLGADDFYQVTIQRSGEINDDGFVDECATT